MTYSVFYVSFSADWDRLLAEANRKQHVSLSTDKIIGDGKRPSLLLVTNQKGFVPERYSLKTYQKTNVVTVPISPEGGECNDHQVEYLSPLRRPSYLCQMNGGDSYQRTRIHSTPNPVLGRDKFHTPPRITVSKPVAYHRSIHQRTHHPVDYELRNTVEYIGHNHKQHMEEHNFHQPVQQLSHHSNNNYLVQRQEYDIMMNQC